MTSEPDHHDDHDLDEPITSAGQYRNTPPAKSYVPLKIHPDLPEEVGGRLGPEPTRYGDWEVAGKCTDF